MRIFSCVNEMEFVYVQSNGCLYLADSEDGRSLIARGYSGKGSGLNQPDAERQIAVGPIPRGVWRISSSIHHSRLGALSFPLSYGETPDLFEDPHGRTGFFIHGDNKLGNGSASSGCIIIPRAAREFIDALVRNGFVRLLRVEAV